MTRSRGFWNLIAKSYSKQAISDPANYEAKLAQTRALMHPDMTVLEFGCGTGSTALLHAPHVAHITGIDYSPKMIAIAQAKPANDGNVAFHTSTLEDWKAPDASYDMVLGLNILHLLPDHRGAIDIAYRLLKPGGYLITSTACLGDMGGIVKHLLPIGSALRIMPYVAQFTSHELEADMKNAGFAIKQSQRPSPNQGVFHICQKPA